MWVLLYVPTGIASIFLIVAVLGGLRYLLHKPLLEIDYISQLNEMSRAERGVGQGEFGRDVRESVFAIVDRIEQIQAEAKSTVHSDAEVDHLRRYGLDGGYPFSFTLDGAENHSVQRYLELLDEQLISRHVREIANNPDMYLDVSTSSFRPLSLRDRPRSVLSEVRRLVRHESGRAYQQAIEGNPDRMFEHLGTAFQLAEMVGSCPGIKHGIVALGCRSDILESIRRTAIDGNLPSHEITRLREWLGSISEPDRLRILEGERLVARNDLQDRLLFESDEWDADTRRAFRFMVNQKKANSAIDRIFERVSELAFDGLHGQEAEEFKAELREGLPLFSGLFFELYIPSALACIRFCDRSTTDIAGTQLLLLIEIFEHDRGELAASLDQLV
ncbi:MAG: hypothetical protein AAGI30_10610, partial [Planctomycetota bacterium]